MSIINERWSTNRLLFNDIKFQEIKEVQRLYEDSSQINRWGERGSDRNYIQRCYESGDLPPEGEKNKYKLQTIRLMTDGQHLTGFMSLYHDYPSIDAAYISFFCIGNDYKSKGYGQEAIHHLVLELERLQYKQIRVNVALKNWPALRFWSKLGFDRIGGLYGDKEYSDSAHADMELIRMI